MPKQSPRWEQLFEKFLVIASTLAGLPWAVVGCVLLPLSLYSLVIGDYAAGHLWQFLIIGLATAAIGGGTVAVGVYTLVVTRAFRRWIDQLPPRDRAIAYVAMLGVVWNIPFWWYTFLLWRTGGL